MLDLKKLKVEAIPTSYLNHKTIDCCVVYRVSNFRWEESNDPIYQDVEYFYTEQEAIKHLNELPQVVGFTSIVESMTFDLDYVDKSVETFNPEDYTPYCIDTVDSLLMCQGKDIIGSIIIEWSYEKFVGYARNLLSIGIAGEWPFPNLKTEVDLITGNEGCTWESCYSVLLTKEEVEESVSQGNLDEQISHELHYRNWRWNHFKNNPKTFDDRIEEIIKFVEDKNDGRVQR